MHLMEEILSTKYTSKCAISAIIQIKCFRTCIDMDIFSSLVRTTRTQNLSAPFSYILYTHIYNAKGSVTFLCIPVMKSRIIMVSVPLGLESSLIAQLPPLGSQIG
jgi:hypothetical protein